MSVALRNVQLVTFRNVICGLGVSDEEPVHVQGGWSLTGTTAGLLGFGESCTGNRRRVLGCVCGLGVRELLSTCCKAGRRDSTEVPTHGLAGARQYMRMCIPSILC